MAYRNRKTKTMAAQRRATRRKNRKVRSNNRKYYVISRGGIRM